MTDRLTETAPKKTGRVRRAFRNAGFVTSYILLGGLASIVAGLAAVVLLFAALPFMIFYAFAILYYPLTLLGIYKVVSTGIFLASPLTFLLFPLTAFFMRRPIARHFVLPVIGLVGGTAIMWIWFILYDRPPSRSSAAAFAIVLGGIPGLASGMFYAGALREISK